MNYKEKIERAKRIWEGDFLTGDRKYKFCTNILKSFYQNIKRDFKKNGFWKYQEAITYMKGAERFILSLNNEDIKTKRS